MGSFVQKKTIFEILFFNFLVIYDGKLIDLMENVLHGLKTTNLNREKTVSLFGKKKITFSKPPNK